jgi:hypothetical protein
MPPSPPPDPADPPRLLVQQWPHDTPVLAVTSDDVELLDRLSRHPNPATRRAVAFNPATGVSTLERLAGDPIGMVRAPVGARANATMSMLRSQYEADGGHPGSEGLARRAASMAALPDRSVQEADWVPVPSLHLWPSVLGNLFPPEDRALALAVAPGFDGTVGELRAQIASGSPTSPDRSARARVLERRGGHRTTVPVQLGGCGEQSGDLLRRPTVRTGYVHQRRTSLW